MGIWDLVAAPILKIIDKVVPDRAAADAAKAQLQQMVAQGALAEELAQLQAVTTAQSDINKVEAASTSLFVAGWRPYVGWICGTGLGLDCIVRPLVNWVATLCGHPVEFPSLNDPLLKSTLAGMLGLGYGLRTYEKSQGIAGNH
jgi:hypothetical protein